jgi:hypothetical protein
VESTKVILNQMKIFLSITSKEAEMKKAIFSLLFFFVVFGALSYAQAPPRIERVKPVYHRIENNYLKGLSSDNAQLKVSCAYFLGELKSERAIIPLMAMFRNAKDEGTKLVAAWSLLKIGNPRGVYFVKSSIESGNEDNINSMLRFLYKDYCLKTNGKIDKD